MKTIDPVNVGRISPVAVSAKPETTLIEEFHRYLSEITTKIQGDTSSLEPFNPEDFAITVPVKESVRPKANAISAPRVEAAEVVVGHQSDSEKVAKAPETQEKSDASSAETTSNQSQSEVAETAPSEVAVATAGAQTIKSSGQNEPVKGSPSAPEKIPGKETAETNDPTLFSQTEEGLNPGDKALVETASNAATTTRTSNLSAKPGITSTVISQDVTDKAVLADTETRTIPLDQTQELTSAVQSREGISEFTVDYSKVKSLTENSAENTTSRILIDAAALLSAQTAGALLGSTSNPALAPLTPAVATALKPELSIQNLAGVKPVVAAPPFSMISEQRASSLQTPEKTKSLPRSMEAKVLERVEQVLKEAVKSKDGKQISFRLDPPSLGSMQVDISIRDGALHARIVPESSAVGNFLREKGYDLVGALRKLGLNVEKITVSISADQPSFSDAGSGNSSLGSGVRQDSGKSQQGESGSEQYVPQRTAQPTVILDDHWVA